MVYRDDDVTKMVREKTKQAIALAMGGGWQAAAAMNREILEVLPDDADSWNRLGKALMEQGDAAEAKQAFHRVLELAPANAIAKKNLDRCEAMSPGCSTTPKKVFAAKAFISDSGKSAQVSLLSCADPHSRPMVSPGEAVALVPSGGTLAVHDQSGSYLGLVPPTIGHRLICLADGGNVYEGAIASASTEAVRLVLWETYQHPSQRSKTSFPSQQSSATPARNPEPAESWAPPILSGVDEDDISGSLVAAGVTEMLDDGMPDDAYLPDEEAV